MNKIHTLILSLVLLVGFDIGALAQGDIRLLTADMARLFDNYYKTVEAQSRFRSAFEQAQAQLETMAREGEALVAEHQRLIDEARNPALSADARQGIERSADEKVQQIQEKQREMQQFQANTQQVLQQRQMNHRQLTIEEIRAVIANIARARGANLVLDTSGGAAGTPSVLFSEPGFDITEEALRELNKGRPAAAAGQ